MKLKKILSLILTVSIITTSFSSVVQISAQTDEESSSQASKVAAAKDSNVQTAEKPIEITEEFVIKSKYDFSKFAARSKYCESNVKVTLACNIDMKGTVIKPIKEFSGVFDGCGYTIINLKIEDKSIAGKNSEFSFIKTLSQFAEIKNVTFDNYIIEGKPNISKVASLIVTNHGTVSGVDIINGSINGIDKKTKSAGFVLNNEEDGVIENCFVGNIRAKDSNIRSGFVGTNHGKITNCSTTLSVNSKDVAGGFVSENHGTIEECSFKGEVSSKKCAGGFCGRNSGEIVSCKSEGLVKASAKKGATICGGFVGENSGIINDCSSTGKVEGQEYVGGFVGINNDKGEISSCKATCDVKSHTYVASIYCGGFVGLDAGKIEDCCFEGKVDGCVDSEKVLGGVIGGLIAVIIIAAIIYLLVTYIKKHNAEIALNKANNTYDEAKNEKIKNVDDEIVDVVDVYEDEAETNFEKELGENNKSIFYDECNGDLSIYLGKYGENLSEEKKNRLTELKNSFDACHDAYIDFRKEQTEENIKLFDVERSVQWTAQDNLRSAETIFKNAINRSLIVVPISIVILTISSGVPIRLTAGRKCAYVAGFCGLNVGEIIKCNASSSSMKAKSLHNKYNRCGGFVGTNSGTIKDSKATGNEIYNKTYTGGYLGGFVGENFGKIENGTTTASVTNGKCTGGFCGKNSGEINGSKSEGCAKANAKTVETKCGGFVGNNDEKGKIDGCTSSGSVTGQEYVGGFCGDNTGEIIGSNSEGNATAKTVSNTNRCGGFVGENSGVVKDSSSTGSVTGEEHVGGFVGINKSEISSCNAHGKATAKTKTNTALAGGFVAENEKGTIINCTSTGGADSRSSSGQAKAGGFVGINKASIMSSKASGNVYLSAGTFYKDDGCGGFVGKNDKGGSIDGCYAEAIVETTNKKKGGGFVGEARSKSMINDSKCKTKTITKSVIKKQTKFYEHKDKKAIIEKCYAN